MRESHSQHGRRLIEAYCHGEADADQLQKLATMLADDASMRRQFLEAMDIHAALRWQTTSQPANCDDAPAITSATSSRWRVGAWMGIAAAIVLAVSLIGVMLNPPAQTIAPPATTQSTDSDHDVPAAVMTATQDVRWNSNPISAGEGLAAGDEAIAIDSGTLEISLLGSTTMWVTGPAQFTIVDDARVVLQRGRLHARSEPGFTVELSPSLRLVDLGTEFGVIARDGEPDDLWINQGQVRIEVRDESGQWVARRTITAGAPGRHDDLPVRVVSTMPSLIGLWRFDERESGRGD